jgi:hypothetical protein
MNDEGGWMHETGFAGVAVKGVWGAILTAFRRAHAGQPCSFEARRRGRKLCASTMR